MSNLSVKYFKCCGCKKMTAGEPAMANNAGMFCITCKANLHEKARVARADIRKEISGICKYCGTTKKGQILPDQIVCTECIKWRDRSLVLIRHSDVAALYINKAEGREVEGRLARNEAKRAEVKRVEAEVVEVLGNPIPPAIPAPVDRLARLEKMMENLLKNLGETA